MSREIVDLARSSLRVFDREVSPDYAALRKALDGELGRNAIEGFEVATLQARANYRWLGQAVQQLPRTEMLSELHKAHGSSQPTFVTGQQSEAKLLQASILWTHRTHAESLLPHYLVGVRQEKRRTGLLLHPAYSADLAGFSFIRKALREQGQRQKVGSLISVEVSTKGFRDYKNDVQRRLGEPYAAEELSDIYDVDEQCFRLTAYSPGAQTLKKDGLISQEFTQAERSELHCSDGEVLSQLPAEAFAGYDVFGAISRLAVTFGKVKEVDALLPLLQPGNESPAAQAAVTA